jgi:hypothetical protein
MGALEGCRGRRVGAGVSVPRTQEGRFVFAVHAYYNRNTVLMSAVMTVGSVARSGVDKLSVEGLMFGVRTGCWSCGAGQRWILMQVQIADRSR